jgi:hypothetical protein
MGGERETTGKGFCTENDFLFQFQLLHMSVIEQRKTSSPKDILLEMKSARGA